MNSHQIYLVQETFRVIAPQAEEAAALFYKHLFELDPALRPLFKSDLKHQGSQLMATLTLVVKGLSQPESIMMAVQHLGQRHTGYGVHDEDYETVGEALLWALGDSLGGMFTPEVAQAWSTAYTMLALLMQEVAARAEPVSAL